MTTTFTIDRYKLDDLMLSIDVDVPDDDDDFPFEPDGAYMMTGYSGRCMYGDRCVGIVCADPAETMFRLGVEIGGRLANDEIDQATADAFLRSSQDSMGLSSIVYFPRLAVEGGDA